MVNQLFDDITRTLYNEFGDNKKYYVEDVEQNLTKPCFTVGTLNPIVKSHSLVRYSRIIPIVIHYFTDKDNTSEAKRDCNSVAERLWYILEYLKYGDVTIRGKDMSWGIIGDVLQFHITYAIDFYKQDEKVYMEEGLYNDRPIPAE